jgi:hypothetical protein
VIGFLPTCPGVAVPEGRACEAAIATVDDIGSCIACVGTFASDCAVSARVPDLAEYPAECNLE